MMGMPGNRKNVDMVNHPPHYNDHPSGVECIEVARHFNYNLGNVIKYVWRAGRKGELLQDLEKAAFYLQDEINSIKRRKKELEEMKPVQSLAQEEVERNKPLPVPPPTRKSGPNL